MSGLLHGGCLCGAVRYAVQDAFVYALNCHCSQCRRATGAACKPFGGIKRDQLTVTKGADNLWTYGDPDDAADFRCKTCGSFLWSVVREGQWVHVTFGTLDQTPAKTPTEHIFAGSKADWEEICDRLPQHDTFG